MGGFWDLLAQQLPDAGPRQACEVLRLCGQHEQQPPPMVLAAAAQSLAAGKDKASLKVRMA